MWVHKPDNRWKSWVPNFSVAEFKPALDPFDLQRGVNAWIVTIMGKEIAVRETVEQLEKMLG